MPELPEVQTVIEYLKKQVLNQTIKDVKIYHPKLLKNASVQEFTEFMVGEKFEKLGRKGKFLLFYLSNNKSFVVHLRMEGKLFAQPKDSQPNLPQLLAEIELDDYVLRYYDTRKFGTFEILNTHDLTKLPSVNKLAMDAIDDDFTGVYLYDRIHHLKSKIKNLLLDQSIVAGIGNIYVNEILFDTNINPTREANTLTLKECNAIAHSAKKILNESIKHSGTTIHTFKVNDVQAGGYQEFLQVHGKRKKPCPRCGQPIAFTKVNGRGTYYCPRCQK